LHTDEYEIALFREVDVCKGQIRNYQRILKNLEELHGLTSAAFQDRMRQGDLPPSFAAQEWHDTIEALRRWKETQVEYERLLNTMKISAS